MTPDEAKIGEMLRILQSQRDAASVGYIEAMGELAGWRARWDDVSALEARIAELKPPQG